MTGPLAGIRVIDLSIWVQGPMAATLLADMGADVVKVERAGGGDFSRSVASLFGVDVRRDDASNLLWALCNRNKRAMTLDLHRAKARPVFRRLLQGADVLLTNLHPRTLAAFEADEERVRAANPRIVYARALGLGELGPRAGDPCHDTLGMAYGGFLFTSAAAPEMPQYPPGALSDVLSGTMLAFGVMAALRERDRTGAGQSVSTSQLQSLLWLQSLNLGVAANLGERFEIHDRRCPSNPLANSYRCGDARWLALGLILEEQWSVFCQTAGLGALSADHRFGSLADRARHASALVDLLDHHFATRPRDEWLVLLRAADLWVSPVNHVEDLVTDSQVTENGYLTRDSGGLHSAGMPFTLSGYRPPACPAPAYGADTDAVLTEAGYSEEEVLALRMGGLVW